MRPPSKHKKSNPVVWGADPPLLRLCGEFFLLKLRFRRKVIIMTLWEAFLCGILQGLAEFLPISSSGHLALAHTFFGIESTENLLSFDILLHLATLAVVFMVYYKDIFALVAAFFSVTGKLFRGKFRYAALSEDEKTVLLLILATLPLAAAFFVKDAVEFLSGYARAVGIVLVLNGFLLLLADLFAKKRGERLLSPKGAFFVGLFQVMALVPGLSRSGSTIAGGMLFGLSRKHAVRFSFLMSIPAVLGANIVNIPDVWGAPSADVTLACALVGMGAAFVSGFLAIRLLTYIAKKETFGFFAYYCIIVGAVAAIFG